jgi:signal transduction histidine kinase
VLWFAAVAMKNEQLASKQRLTDAYHVHLLSVQRQLDDDWQTLAAQIDEQGAQASAQQVFAQVAALAQVDSLIAYDDAGRLIYPTLPEVASEPEPAGARWHEAAQLEHELEDPRAAAEVYREIARQSSEPGEKARALQAEARCLFKSNEDGAALRLVADALRSDDLASATDAHGRLIAPNTSLMAIERIAARQAPDELQEAYETILSRLTSQLQDYGNERLPASQRLFLMKRLAEIAPGKAHFPTLRAEDLAAQFVAAHPAASRDAALQRSQLPGVWQLATPSRRFILLFRNESVIARSIKIATATMLPQGAEIALVPPGQPPARAELLSVSAGDRLPGWRLSLSLRDPGQLDAAVAQQKAIYLWIGGVVAISTAALAVFIARAFQRQLRLAGLKNDLVGTVSHELKTPLASMRLLVDTLLDADRFDEQQAREYLRLIAKENLRLSRLIESFLTFSRLEQGRHTFDFAPMAASQVIERAVEAAGERFREPDCRLTTEIEEGLPAIHGDADALVTVLLNLLDNAYKYSQGDRRIVIRAFARDGRVFLAVEDNGIGLSRAAARKVFQRFYQVDRSLARRGQGCGLGLSIVDTIVRAHGGTASVESRPGQGSTFTVSLPTA